MHPKPASFLPYSEFPHATAPPTAEDQILVLQQDLVRALQCAGRLRLRTRAAKRELRRARRELARTKAASREQLHAMRLELLATEAQRWALDEVCRALLLTIEQAACFEVDEQPPTAGVSP
jgi:hypothetical protein